MKNEIRSNYIKKLLSEKDALKEKLEETASNSIREILGKTVNETINNIISEDDKDEDSYDVEEVDVPVDAKDDADGKDETNKSEDNDGDPDTDNIGAADFNDENPDSMEDTGGEEMDNDAEGDEMWNDLEQYKDAEGDYDLTGMDSEKLIKVLKLMNPEDGVKVVQNDNGTITLNDDETEREYVIEIGDDYMNESLGYTDSYQSKTAMTTPNNNEPSSPKKTYSMDKGAPTGVGKPYPGNSGNMDPFNDEVNEGECCDDGDCNIEIELDDTDDELGEATNVGGYVQQNSTSKSHVPNSLGRYARNQSKGGEYRGTQEPRYANEEIDRIMKKANRIYVENQQLKAIIPELRTKIQESILINYNIGKAVKLITENTTTREEKKSIIRRLGEAKTMDESNKIYAKIDAELKNSHKMDNLNNVADSQLAESKRNIVETQMYQSDDLSETLSLMNRVDGLYKKK